jgi:osmoprotectant transport system ATP-binding protein
LKLNFDDSYGVCYREMVELFNTRKFMIKVEKLTKIFPGSGAKAVEDVSFTLEKGEIGCIIGTSGCGKTTTLKMINRLIEPTEGQIFVDENHSHTVDPISWRRKIGYVVQKAGLLPHMTVKQNISLLSTILEKDQSYITRRVRELMSIINLPYDEYQERYPSELSGGQQQRVGIARALMEDPPIMLMDEPFGALDPVTRNSLHSEFWDLNQKLHKTILIVTHDLTEAFKLGDLVILMDQGKIVQKGSKEDFLKRPANKFVEEFVKGEGLV